MKNLIVLILFFMGLCATAQTSPDSITERSLSLELQGVHNLVGINFDSRFKGNHGLGYRVGIGYAYGYSDFSFIVDASDKIQGVAVPLEVNYLLGKRNSKLELGVGISLGYYWERYNITYKDYHNVYDSGASIHQIQGHENRFGYFTFGNIGYRLQTKRGFQLRVGWAPSINFKDKHCLHRGLWASYVSLGWRL